MVRFDDLPTLEVPSNINHSTFLTRNFSENMISGVPVSTYTAGFHFILQGNSSLLLTTWVQRLFPETLSSWEGVISLVLRHAPAEPAQGKQAGSLLAAQTQALPEHSTQNAHWEQTNLLGHLLCSSKPQPGQVAHTPPWCCLCSDLQHCTGLCSSLQRLWHFPVLTESQ